MLWSLPRQRGLTLRVSHRLLACKAAPSSAPPKGRPTLSHVCWASGSQHGPRHKPDVPRRGPRAAEYTRERERAGGLRPQETFLRQIVSGLGSGH